MKQTILIILISYSLNIQAQSFLVLDSFSLTSPDENSLKTSDLLDKVNWEGIKEYCDTTNGFSAKMNKDGLITNYCYSKTKGPDSYFTINSFNGFVLEYYSNITHTTKPIETSYFDRKLWKSYVKEQLPELPDSFLLRSRESSEIMKAYYILLGVDSRDEYGWICEYSTMGALTTRRSAVIEIVRNQRVDLLRRMLDYPNIQTQLYAADGLIYIDSVNKKLFKGVKKNDSYTKRLLKSFILTKSDWEKIYSIRDSEKLVKTCGNCGSYKIYKKKASTLLSKKAIAEHIKNYNFHVN